MVTRFLFAILSSFLILNFAHATQLTIVTGNDYGPYSDEMLPDGGVYTYFVKKVLNKMNFKYSVEFYPWARGYEMVKKNRATLSFPYIKTNQRETEVIYSEEALMQANLYLVTNSSEANENKNNLSDFTGSIYCNPVGYAKDPAIQEMITKNKLTEIKEFDAASCLKALIEMRADIVTANDEYINERRKEGMSDKLFRRINKPLAENKLYVIFPKASDPNFIKEFNKQVHNFMSTEEYKNKMAPYK